MINTKGIVQNNTSVSKFLKELKCSSVQYKTLTKIEERALIDKYVSEGREDELRKLLVMHNIRMVFSIAKKYCKDTRDFDNMFAKGLYGLTYAANRFNLFEPIRTNIYVGDTIEIDENGNKNSRKVFVKKVKINPSTCKPEYIKFCTFANMWIFKYIVDEFGKKSIIIDNNSISIDDEVRIKNTTNNNQTMENYINDMISPDYRPQSIVSDMITENDVTEFYGKLSDYIRDTNELTATEKQIVIDTYYNNMKIRDIAEKISENQQSVILKKKSALAKIRKYLETKMNIKGMSDIIAI